ncbi:MAG: endonuclease/exonuclease/phosphatase family protein [Gammaproteobacteria bacterium]|nr:endonuclease/exonuclease/phosphatase family protein [Gammaproteobacteria bacterium]MDH5172054.1 endonuclease/exonuclease/phosphatase family protein [Gammaproteobacteria bacterium]
MKTSNTKHLLTTPLLIALACLLCACSNGGSDGKPYFKSDSLKVTTFNLGLALNFVPFTRERLVADTALLSRYDSDVICLQEVWLDEQVEAVTEALKPTYPEIYTVPAEQVFSEAAACTNEEITPFAQCVNNQCPGLSGTELVACAPVQCGGPLFQLPPTCLDAVLGSVGIPDVTVQAVVDAVTKPAGKFAYDGALGLILASKYPLEAREFQDFIDDSTSNHRGALYAEINLNKQTQVVACTHPTANLSIAYPTSGKHGSWEGENRFMQEQMIAFANTKAGKNPIFFGGDFNCSIANAATGVDGEFAGNCQLWLDNGFADPAGEQLPCTFCYEDNLILKPDGNTGGTGLDHVFVKNLEAGSSLVARRVFDTPVSIEALVPPSELMPEDSPKMTHPSDHFGVEVDVKY